MHQGKTYIVTGCSSGIGARTTAVLKEHGASVIGIDRNPSPDVDQLIQGDLSDPSSIDTIIEAVPDGAHGLANIAGVPPTLDAETVLRVNLLGLRRLTLGLVPRLANNASIVNLASLAGFGWTAAVPQVKATLALDFYDDLEAFCDQQGLRDTGGRSYFLSKEAVVVWTFQNRWTWRDRGIRMNAVSPGPVQTPILDDFLETLGERAEEDMRVMDRPGTPDDIAPVVSFLLSDQTTWFRGANLTLDGGMSSYLLMNSHDLHSEPPA